MRPLLFYNTLHIRACIFLLICFHYIDCIGSAFNVKGAMVCPNCRQTEAGHWLYGNSSAPPLFDSDFDVDDGNLAELSVQRLLNEVETQYLIDEEVSLYSLFTPGNACDEKP